MSFVRLPRIVHTTSFWLASLYAFTFAVSVAILGLVVFWAVESALERHIAMRIDSEVAFLESKYWSEGREELMEEVHERIESFVSGGHMEYLVVNASGERLAGNLAFIPATTGWHDVAYPADARNPAGIRVRMRVVALDNDIRFAVGDDLELIRQTNDAILRSFKWMALAFVPLSLAGGVLLSRGFLRRVDAITQTAEAIIGGDLGRRIPLRGTNDDLDRLSVTLNRMLDRIADLIERLRQVSIDIAHDLRTPLTRLRNNLEAAQALVESNPDYKSKIESAIAETDDILETFSALLRIAQVESGNRRAGFHDVDLSVVFETVADAFGPAAEAEGKVLTANVEPGVTFFGDRELLVQMLANLAENAIRHTPRGCRIEMTLAHTAVGVVGSVADDGPGVPAEDHERILRRLYRLERSRTTPGSGLGLALVAAVANLHEIELSVGNNMPGLRITMKFDTHQRPL